MENGCVLVYCPLEESYISKAIASINQRTLSRVAENMVRRIVGTSSTFFELYFRFYFIVVLRSEISVAF
jgi:hypothetical protein